MANYTSAIEAVRRSVSSVHRQNTKVTLHMITSIASKAPIEWIRDDLPYRMHTMTCVEGMSEFRQEYRQEMGSENKKTPGRFQGILFNP